MKQVMRVYVCIGILGCISFGGTAWLCSKVHRLPKLATVNMQTLIAHHSHDLAQENKRGKVSAHKIREVSEQLKEKLNAFAGKHNLILLTKGSVMGGELPDYTDQVLVYDEVSAFDLSKRLFRGYQP